ncbi:MAG: guanine deaminase [Pseudomonadota bacterium]
MVQQYLRGEVVSFSAMPDSEAHPGLTHLPDGIVVVDDARIVEVCSVSDFTRKGGALERVDDVRPGIVLPGFIDTHVHYSQMDIVASYGNQLLDWLNNYAFPAELAFASQQHAELQAERFMQRMLACGTTAALVFTTVHPHATDTLFEAAQAMGACVVSGKVMMNRNAPDALLDTDDGLESSRLLLERWHQQGRLRYAITPRFAITSSAAQLAAAGALLQANPGVYLHTHLSEHPDEVAATLALYPEADDYLDIYARYGLLQDHSVFAHSIHLSDAEMQRLREHGAKIAFCPSSNLFLGSGLLDLRRMREFAVGMGVGSDVGGGPSLSLLDTLADGYKVAQLGAHSWHPLAAFYSATRGGAETLNLAHEIGSLEPGLFADLVVLDAAPDSACGQRLANAQSLTERMFAYLQLGGETAVARTYVAGVLQYQRAA